MVTSFGFAAPRLVPSGPSTDNEGQTNLSSTINYEKMIKILNDIERTSKGTVEVFTLDEYGKSEQGRSLYVAKVGEGDTKVWVQASIHGDEQLVSEAVLDVLKTLGSNGAKDVQTILDNVTIYAIPMYNPDGIEMNTRSTMLIDQDTGEPLLDQDGDPRYIDLNRDWKVDLMGEGFGFVASESRALYEFWTEVKPDFALDMHHQGIKEMPDSNKSVSFSLGISLAPNGPTLPGLKDGEYNDLTRQLQSYVYDDIKDYGYSHIDRYVIGGEDKYEIDIVGGVVSAMMLGINYDNLNEEGHSCPAVFFETKGNTRDGNLGQRANGYLTKQNYHALKSFLYGIASEEVYHVNPDSWEEIPRHPIIGYFTDYAGVIVIE
ncbi:Tat (twin-arginine translocation) pathway signal sequence [Isachenkonia alkalipeptolytica]|uniref:Tat (Twin-arginine translocation) pathway signal sequence n=2 Tax=Isachenkonia alkalipeptolytica TaxID=2565777 RepID=A0AA43XML8_9CLOT|nr:Tat (twin-arginine translocation) pathway signal sequence [Isachenkonia alkalipeptolytica]